MATHDYEIDNQTPASLRADLNNALAAIVSNNSNATAPSTTFANMFWYDSANNILKMRNEANSAFINIGYIDQSGGFRVLDNTQVVTAAGVQAGLLGDQATATWEAGTGTTQSLASPANVKAAVIALAPTPAVVPYQIAAWGEVNSSTDKVHGGNFDTVTGNSNGAVITFDTNLADTTYSVIATPIGGDVQGITTKSISSKTVSGFTIRFMTARSGSDTTCQFTWQVVRSI